MESVLLGWYARISNSSDATSITVHTAEIIYLSEVSGSGFARFIGYSIKSSPCSNPWLGKNISMQYFI